uniref:G_PROTEIN_RECEP_F1_2 domain-containing protein n=1 Tax=Panagrellus redivivus TaxID=6233 RepID=A0A7E4WC41_PANRE
METSEYKTTYALLYYLSIAILHAPQIIMISVTIFLAREFRNVHSVFRQSFYVFVFIFTLCYNVAALAWAVAYLNILSSEIEIAYNLIILRYYTLVVGSWNTAVCVNRVTAIISPVKHSTIWSKTTTTIAAACLLAYPIIFQTPFLQNSCWKTVASSMCLEYQVLNMYVVAVSVIAHALLGLLLITMALAFARCKGWLATQSAETKLIAQTLMTSLLLMCVGITKMVSMLKFYDGNMALHQELALVGTILLAMYSYIVVGGLFLASPTFRKKYAEFYHCKTAFSVRVMYSSQVSPDHELQAHAPHSNGHYSNEKPSVI